MPTMATVIINSIRVKPPLSMISDLGGIKQRSPLRLRDGLTQKFSTEALQSFEQRRRLRAGVRRAVPRELQDVRQRRVRQRERRRAAISPRHVGDAVMQN